MLLRGHGSVGEAIEAVDQRLAEAFEAVAMGGDGSALGSVEVLPYFFRSVDTVVEVGDEGADGAFKVNVVLPQGVIGVEEEGLRGAFERGTHGLNCNQGDA